MNDWISGFNSQIHSVGTLFTAFALGFIGLITSCCNVPVFTAVVGYSGAAAPDGKKKSLIWEAFFFLVGVLITLMLTGVVFSFFGKMVLSGIGKYWKLFAGAVFVFFGLVTLQWLPLNLSIFTNKQNFSRKGMGSALLFGMVLASSTTVCNALCNPVFALTLGTAFVQNNVFWGALILLAFGLGYGLPLAIGMAGISLGLNQLSSRMNQISVVIKYVGGALLLAIGFYFLLTM